MRNQSEMIIYQTEDGLTKVNVTFEEDTVWSNENWTTATSTSIIKVTNMSVEGLINSSEALIGNLRTVHLADLDVAPVEANSSRVKVDSHGATLPYTSAISGEISEYEWQPEIQSALDSISKGAYAFDYTLVSDETKKPTTQEIVAQYNKAKRQYTAFFQKTIEIEDELGGTS